MNMQIIRIWHPRQMSIRRSLFFKREIVVGSDVSADLYLEDLAGLSARLDFSNGEIFFLKEARSEKLVSHEIFKIGDYVLEWRSLSILNRRMAFVFGAIVFVASGLLWFEFRGEIRQDENSNCSFEARQLHRGMWDSDFASEGYATSARTLSQSRKYFLGAIESEKWVQARSEIEAMKRVFGSVQGVHLCDGEGELDRLESKLMDRIVLQSLHERRWLDAARLLSGENSSAKSHRRERWLRRIKSRARDLFLESYEVEDIDPVQSEKLLNQAEEICQALSEETDCYKSR